ncbi:Holliday junction resolvase RuvX [Desulfomicrobium baculatum]|uniref:Putative pre-16S rRNA nuclease n=1 Tax=Desulfomicrobium baculatum (strain DSM 4028 / VKM B-1378 / X) TaxID=525897 RepID=C7LWJ8_DESBD|nr:Holliday junction resolvase RuvX [Desulfomicrobium baculatum]ACU89881.1 Holliday junction resolvase YqgF [Desulfomicrobium baculatum DSM 4028]
MKILGIDYGQKRIGLAMARQGMAFPFKTLDKSTRDKLFADLMSIIESEGVEAIVLGLPLDMNGDETLTTRQVLNFRDSLARRTELPIHLVNEALTSFDARQRLREAGVPERKHKEMLDQMAAVCILETYLENS